MRTRVYDGMLLTDIAKQPYFSLTFWVSSNLKFGFRAPDMVLASDRARVRELFRALDTLLDR